MSSDYNLRLETFVHLPCSFLKKTIAFPTYFVSHMAAEEHCVRGYCVLWKSSFLSRAWQRHLTLALQTGHACQDVVRGDMLVCMVSPVKSIP